MTQPDAQTDATLKLLDLAPGTRGKLIAGLWGTRTSFAVVLPHAVDHLVLRVAASAPGGVVRVMGRPVPSGGEVSEPIPLPVGRTTITIDVTAPDGVTTKAYHVHAARGVRTPNWERLAQTTAFAPRDSAGEMVFNDHMWIIGGYLPELVGDVWRSPDGVAWTKVGAIPDESGVNIPVNFVHDGRMWIVSQAGRFYSSANGVDWKLVCAQPPWAVRYGAGGAVFGGRMWILGGMGSGVIHNDVWSSADGEHWTREIEHAPWSPRQLFGNVVVHRDRLFVVGGGVSSYQPFRAYRDVWSSPDGRRWTPVTDEAPWLGRIWSSCAVYRDRLWLLGGFRSQPAWENFRDAWHSPDGQSWSRLDCDDMWEPRHEVSAYVFRGGLWVVAGNAWPLMNDAWRLQIDGFTFTSQPVVEEYAHALYRYRAKADFHTPSHAPVRYRLAAAPPWLAIDPDTGLVQGLAPEPGLFPVCIEAAAGAESVRQEYTIHVISV